MQVEAAARQAEAAAMQADMQADILHQKNTLEGTFAASDVYAAALGSSIIQASK